jgi:hypothetical protein
VASNQTRLDQALGDPAQVTAPRTRVAGASTEPLIYTETPASTAAKITGLTALAFAKWWPNENPAEISSAAKEIHTLLSNNSAAMQRLGVKVAVPSVETITSLLQTNFTQVKSSMLAAGKNLLTSAREVADAFRNVARTLVRDLMPGVVPTRGKDAGKSEKPVSTAPDSRRVTSGWSAPTDTRASVNGASTRPVTAQRLNASVDLS